MDAASWLLRRWQYVRIIQHRDRGTWRLACVVMIDVVVELEMLVIADVLLLFRVFVFRIHYYHNHTKFHNPERPRDHDHTT